MENTVTTYYMPGVSPGMAVLGKLKQWDVSRVDGGLFNRGAC